LLAVNIGNTHVGLGVFALPTPDRVGVPQSFISVPSPADGLFAPDFAPRTHVDAALVAAVDMAPFASVAAWISETFDIKALQFPNDVPSPFGNAYKPPDSVGADRLASAVAAYAEFQAPCVIIDAGTAITVDAVSADGVFQGGTIMPGLGLSICCLSEGTAQLPDFTPGALGPPIGRSTRSAITSGVSRGLAGAVDRLIADVATELDGPAKVVLTGGDADRFAALCQTTATLRPHLALTGLAVAYALSRG